MIESILFDYDGVMADSINSYFKATNKLFELGLGVKYFDTVEEFKNHLGLHGFLKNDKLTEKQKITKIEVYKSHLKNNYPLFKDIKEVLENLKPKYKTGIASGNFKENISDKLIENKLDHLVDCIVGYEDTKNHKPDPEPLLLCISKLKTKPEKSIYIGDMDIDIAASKNANMLGVIAVSYGYCPLLFKLKDADFIANSPLEILEIIERWENKYKEN